ncbi:MAG TPA: hypothetical protein VK158_01085, partial [Acidobacteriota bacterium]|nr:hypothetical protein [Acidobacteriota bacterium]
MDTLYLALLAQDRRHSWPLTSEQKSQIIDNKQVIMREAIRENPLADAVYFNKPVRVFGLSVADLQGPTSFFRTNVYLQKNRRKNNPFVIGREEYPHNDVVDMFEDCVPNSKLRHLPAFHMGRLDTGLFYALMAGGFMGMTSGEWDPKWAINTAAVVEVAALGYHMYSTNRSIHHSAPWNSSLYLDLNFKHMCDGRLHLARKEFMPLKDIKTKDYYYN